MSDEMSRLLKHGGRLRAADVEAKIKEMGFERGVTAMLQALAVRDGTLHQETQQVAQGLLAIADNLDKLADVLGLHGDELRRLKGLDNAISQTHPDESN